MDSVAPESFVFHSEAPRACEHAFQLLLAFSGQICSACLGEVDSFGRGLEHACPRIVDFTLVAVYLLY